MLVQKITSSACGILLLLCFALPGTAQQGKKKGNTITCKGNKITFSEQRVDTIMVVDPVSGKEIMKTRARAAEPETLNGQEIHIDEGVPPQNYIDNGSLEEYVLKNLSKELKALPDGQYGLIINELIVDEKGKLVYYKFKGIERQDFEHFGQLVEENSIKGIRDKIEKLFTAAPLMKPAAIKGKVVVAILPSEFLKIVVTVKGHQAAYYKI